MKAAKAGVERHAGQTGTCIMHLYCSLMTANPAVAQMPLIDEFFVTSQVLNLIAAKSAPNS